MVVGGLGKNPQFRPFERLVSAQEATAVDQRLVVEPLVLVAYLTPVALNMAREESAGILAALLKGL